MNFMYFVSKNLHHPKKMQIIYNMGTININSNIDTNIKFIVPTGIYPSVCPSLHDYTV